MRPMSLNLVSWINRTGYGYHGLNIVKAAREANILTALWPLDPIDCPTEYEQTVQEAINDQAICARTMPSITISSLDCMNFHVGDGLRVGWPAFELTKFNNVQAQQLRTRDLILVASHWAKKIVEAEFPSMPCAVVPEGVDGSIFHAGVVPYPLERGDETVFINVGKWEKRKGQEELVSAFNKAFEPSDPVTLVLVCYNPFQESINEYWRDLCTRSKLAEKIMVCHGRLESQAEIAALMAAADCGVFPARAEGWNLDLLEMMSVGKPVIATDYSAHTEYCTPENCNLIKIDRLEIADDGYFFHGEGKWAHLGDAQEEQLIHYMRSVHQLKQSGHLLTNTAGLETARKFSWHNSVRQLMEVIA